MNLYSNTKPKFSNLLTKDQNNQIFNLVGQHCEILSITVIELHRSPDSSGEGDWTKEEVGVLCLIQDLVKKCYFFRIFCLFRKRMVWEYEVNKRMQYSTPKSFLHSFQAKNCMYAFYFVSEQEASLFADYIHDISNELKIEHRLERYKSHEINPVVEAPRRFISHSNSNKTKDSNCFPTRFDRLPSPSNLFTGCFGNKNEMKKKKVNCEDIDNPKHFKHMSHISEFQQKWNQIRREKNNNTNSLNVPILPPISRLSKTFSESVLPVVKETSIHPNSASTDTSFYRNEKSPRLNDRSAASKHLAEKTVPYNDISALVPQFSGEKSLPPCISVFSSPCENAGYRNIPGKNLIASGYNLPISKSSGDVRIPNNWVPPLPPKSSPGLNRRSIFLNPSNLTKIEDGSLLHSSPELKSLNSFSTFVPTVPSFPSKIATAEVKSYNLAKSQQNLDHSYEYDSGSTSSEHDSFTSLPRPPQIVAEKRKSYAVSDQHYEDPSLYHYDILSGQPRPLNSSFFNSLPRIEITEGSFSTIGEEKSPYFVSPSYVGSTPQGNSNDKVAKKVSEATTQKCVVTPIIKQHPFLSPPSFEQPYSGKSVPSKSVRIPPLDDVRIALNSAIKKGVQLRRCDGTRNLSFSRENDG